MRANSERWGRFFWLLLKEQLKSPKIYCLAALCLLFLYVFQNVVFPSAYRMDYGIVVEGADCGEDVIERLSLDGLYHDVLLDSREALALEVRAGRLDCGFVLDERLNEVTDLGNMNGLIDYICSTSTTKGAILKEKVFAAFLMSAAEQTLASFTTDGTTFQEESGQLTEDMVSSFHGFLERNETLQVIFETVDADALESDASQKLSVTDGAGAENGSSNSDNAAAAEFSLSAVSILDKFLALCGTMIFAAAIVYGRTRFSLECRRMTCALRGSDRAAWSFLSILAPVFALSLVIACAYLTGRGFYHALHPASIAPTLLIFLLYGAVCAVWAFLYSLLFRREAMYLGSIVGVIVLSLLTCRPFFRLGAFLPILDTLKWLFPVNYLI